MWVCFKLWARLLDSVGHHQNSPTWFSSQPQLSCLFAYRHAISVWYATTSPINNPLNSSLLVDSRSSVPFKQPVRKLATGKTSGCFSSTLPGRTSSEHAQHLHTCMSRAKRKQQQTYLERGRLPLARLICDSQTTVARPSSDPPR